MKKIAYQAFLGANYGTILQSFGLYYSIKKLGYDCEIIGCDEFINRTLIDYTSVNMNTKEYDTLRTQLTYEQFITHWFKFNSVLGNIQANAVLNPLQQEEITKFDAFICGSDQIWKPGGFWFCAKRYLQYAPAQKRIGYAPSIGLEAIRYSDIKNIPQWRTWLSGIEKISCREKSGAEIIGTITGKEVPVVIDPSLLLDKTEWDTMLPYGLVADEINKLLISGRPYLLAYLLDTYETYKNYIKGIANRLNLSIVWLTGRDNIGPIQINSATTDPAGFVNLVRNAAYICADGFHGCCFAINYHKPFSAMVNQKFSNISRVRSLCKLLNIPERFVYPKDDPNQLLSDFDYEPVNASLARERAISHEYLVDSLREICTTKEEHSKIIVASEESKRVKFIREYNSVPLDDPNNCTGCAACMNMCPVNAISMVPSEFGFLRPEVNREVCIKCGKCLNNCPLRKKPKLYMREKLTKAWAVWATNPFTITRSSSGGMFALMARWMIQQNGVVYGVAWNDKLLPEFRGARTEEELIPMYGSKYVQPTVGYIYQDVKKNLDAGTPVLFSGSGCQVGGLYAYLGGDHELLITTDLICGGTPAQSVFRKYIEWREEQAGSSIETIGFRSKKERGWGLGGIITFANGKTIQFPWWEDEYGILYNQHFIQNTACYVCRFRGIDKRWSDITIGDFWGIGKHGISFDHPTNQGISVVLPNSIKGRTLLSTITNNNSEVISVERPLEEVYPGNAWLKGNYGMRADYDALGKLLAEKQFDQAFDEFFCVPEFREHITL